MYKARFEEIKIEPGKIDFTFSGNLGGEEVRLALYFHLNEPIIPSNDAIAVAFSSLCRYKFEYIYMDLEISSGVIQVLELFNKSTIICKNIIERELKNTGKKCILNFSGGFDSLSMKYLLPDDTKLVSVDFHKKGLEREKEFFNLFDTYIMSTNVRAYKFVPDSNLIGIASALYSEELDARIIYSGNILEAVPQYLRFGDKRTFDIFATEALNIDHVSIARGLTEIATTLIACHYAPELIALSLKSLAKPKTEKSYRKQLILKIISEKFDKKVPTALDFVPPAATPVFGKYFATDFLAIYFLKHFGLDLIQKTYLTEFPSAFLKLSNELSLTFYERYNTDWLALLPAADRGYFLSRMSDAGVVPYDENDYREFRIIADFLSAYYPLINPPLADEI